MNQPLTSSTGGSVTIYNESGYKVQFYVGYFYNGEYYLDWIDNITLFSSGTINIPNASTDIKVAVFYMTFGGYYELFYTESFPSTLTICYKAYGPVWNPQISKIPCDYNNTLNTTQPNSIYKKQHSLSKYKCCKCCCNHCCRR